MGLVSRILENERVVELLRFLFLGTVLEASRVMSQKIHDAVKYCASLSLFPSCLLIQILLNFALLHSAFQVKASFVQGDFAFDWVLRYLEDQNIWDKSRIFRVVARNPALRHSRGTAINNKTSINEKRKGEIDDGRAQPVYQPAPQETDFFLWRGHWITVNVDFDIQTDNDEKRAQVLTLRYPRFISSRIFCVF